MVLPPRRPRGDHGDIPGPLKALIAQETGLLHGVEIALDRAICEARCLRLPLTTGFAGRSTSMTRPPRLSNGFTRWGKPRPRGTRRWASRTSSPANCWLKSGPGYERPLNTSRTKRSPPSLGATLAGDSVQCERACLPCRMGVRVSGDAPEPLLPLRTPLPLRIRRGRLAAPDRLDAGCPLAYARSLTTTCRHTGILT